MSLNDPQWGKRSRTGPPDLDEIWRNVNRRFNELFGRKAPGDSGDDTAPPKRPLPLGGAGLLAALVLLVWLISGSYIVDEGRRGVVTRFGRYTETTTPGLRWHLPFPIEAVEVVDFSQVKTVEIGYRNGNPKNKIAKESLMLTDDENIIDIQFAVQYNLKSAPDYVFNTRKPDDIVFQVAATAMSEVVGRSQMDFVLYEGRAQIAAETEKLMQTMLDKYGTGIYVQKVTLQNTQPPEQVQAAFDDAVKASQDRERQKNEGQAYANDIIPRARGMASRLLQEADGYTASVVQRAEGDASRFKQILVEYNKAPAVTRQRLYLDMIQSVLGNSSKVLIDQKSGASNLLYLPLDQLLKQGLPGTSAPPIVDATRPVAPAPEAAAAIDSGRSRDVSRDRGASR
jgi:modulator of FtsH protease HflK